MIKKEYKTSIYVGITILIVAFFLVQLIFYANKVCIYGVFPDENEHFERILLYVRGNFLFITDNAETLTYGPLRTAPFFYHYLMAQLLKLNLWGIEPHLYFRYINIIFALIRFYFTYLIVKEVVHDRVIRLIILMVITNIMMLVSLSAAVSYDNLINCLAVISFYYLIKIVQNKTVQSKTIQSNKRWYIEMFILVTLIGTVTKITYLPLILVQVVVVVIIYNKKLVTIFKETLAACSVNSFKLKEVLSLVAILFFLFLNANIYLRNIWLYKTPTPDCAKVLGKQTCIDGAGMYQRDFHVKNQNKDKPRLPFWGFLTNFTERVLGSSLAIMGHKSIEKEFPAMHKEIVIMVAALLILFLFNFKRCFIENDIDNDSDNDNNAFNLLFFTALFYLLILFIQNYQTYMEIGIIRIGLQGRYLFPVILNIVIVLCYGSMIGFTNSRVVKYLKWLKWPIFFWISYVFIRGNFYYFIRHTDGSWFKC
ncbi:MAG: hypothetical protein HQK49_07665 [Oligoflexia bacterium]|nr:hypothetical protein [Oligoflexia bacterium]